MAPRDGAREHDGPGRLPGSDIVRDDGKPKRVVSQHYLVQALLPVTDNNGAPFQSGEFGQTRRELTERFGGVTVYERAPARGLWVSEDGEVVQDEVVIFEVMTSELDARWWRDYKAGLQRRFHQETIAIRAAAILPLELFDGANPPVGTGE
jgi:hypothetical protein